MKNTFKSIITLILVLAIFTSCSDDDEFGIPDGQGEVKIELTDGPFPFNFATQANIGIAKIELKNNDNEYITVFEGNSNHNMIGLTNGITANVGRRNIAIGVYTESRVTLSSASVHLSNGDSYNLDSEASGETYSVAINPALTIEEGTSSNILFDLDINNSFSFRGMGGFSFSGWIPAMNLITDCSFHANFRVCDLDQTGTISGNVSVNGNNEEHVQVYIVADGNRIYTHTKVDGSFTFIGVTSGTYTVYASNQDGGSAQVGNITVTSSETTNCTITIN